MPKPQWNIIRHLRLQLKTGYILNPSPSYQYLIRNPPLTQGSLPQETYYKQTELPYLKLYRKVLRRNPLYADERVYPAFGDQEPQALTIAKKQYQFMKEGLSEELAYEKALEYTSDLENDAYLKLKKIQEDIQKEGSKSAHYAKFGFGPELAKWKTIIDGRPYKRLSLLKQAELEYFIQTKILKWNEVDRERRMKDPIFVRMFESFVESLFPVSKEYKEIESKLFQNKFVANFSKLCNINQRDMKTAQPFYIEDYIHYFEKARVNPDISTWSAEDRDGLTSWIIGTLAFQDVLKKTRSHYVQDYLNNMRDSFFPMFFLTGRSTDFALPSIEDIKMKLYQNEIGYKKVDDKTFVKRFYRLPGLLFPEHVYVLDHLRANDKQFIQFSIHDESLKADMNKFGLKNTPVKTIRDMIEEYRFIVKSNFDAENAASNTSTENGETKDFSSALDDLVESVAPAPEPIHDDSSLSREEFDSFMNEIKNKKPLPEGSLRDNKTVWDELLQKYLPTPRTELEKERTELFTAIDPISIKQLHTESDLKEFKKRKTESEVIYRAKLLQIFNAKESLRIQADWAKRGFQRTLSLASPDMITSSNQ